MLCIHCTYITVWCSHYFICFCFCFRFCFVVAFVVSTCLSIWRVFFLFYFSLQLIIYITHKVVTQCHTYVYKLTAGNKTLICIVVLSYCASFFLNSFSLSHTHCLSAWLFTSKSTCWKLLEKCKSFCNI